MSQSSTFFDLYGSLRYNVTFRNKLKVAVADMQKAYVNKRMDDFYNGMVEVMKMCQFNPALLAPYFFPRYPFDSPLSFGTRPHAIAMLAFTIAGFVVIRASRQIGKSTTFSARQLMLCNVIPRYASLFVVPLQSQATTYANKYRELEQAFAFKGKKQNKMDKYYSNGSSVRMLHFLEDAGKARGLTVDEILIDEAQDMNPDLMGQIIPAQSRSKRPSLIYSGTSLHTETLLEDRWVNSSQGVWMCKAGDGKSYLDFSDIETLFKVCDSTKGPTCPITGKLLDVSDGFFEFRNKSALEAGRIGFHIPQVMVKDFVANRLEWGKIYNYLKDNDKIKAAQEIFGHAAETASRELTERELKAICTIQDSEAGLLKKIEEGYYRLVISGCDWGGSDHNKATKSKTSYTLHTVLGVAPDNKIDMLYFRRYSGMEYEAIAEDIYNNHVKWKATVMAADSGVGMYYNNALRKRIPPSRYFIMTYTGPDKKVLAFNSSSNTSLENSLTVNRTEALSSVISAIKMNPSRIRARLWSYSKDFLTDFLALRREMFTNDETGKTYFRYLRPPSKADDAIQAVSFAFVIARFFLGENLTTDSKLSAAIRNAIYANTTGMSPHDGFAGGVHGGSLVGMG